MNIEVRSQMKKEPDFYDEKKYKQDVDDYETKSQKGLELRFTDQSEDFLDETIKIPLDVCTERLKGIFGLNVQKGSACDLLMKIA